MERILNLPDEVVRLILTTMGAKPIRRLSHRFLAPKVYIGNESLPRAITGLVPYLPSKRAFIVVDKSTKPLAERFVIPVLQQFGFTISINDKAIPEPPIPHLDEVRKDVNDFNPDCIIAVGGGSVIDTAKATLLRYERPDIEISKALYILGIRKKVRGFVAIPTTAGTGSEATPSAVLTDTSVTPPKKVTIGALELLPDIAVLIPDIIKGMPKILTIGTGLDAIAHAFDAFMSRQWANPYVDALALQAFKLMFRYLPIAVNDPTNTEARLNTLIGANIAGIAFSNSGAALTHALGHSLGSVFHVHHGMAVGIPIPYVLLFNAKVTDAYVELARNLGIEASSNEEYLHKLYDYIINFYKGIGAPTSYKELGINKDEFESKLDILVEYAMNDATFIFNVRQPNPNEVKRMFRCVYDGKKVDW